MTPGRLTTPAALEHLDAAVTAFAAALEGDLRRPVPGCPGWDLGALAGHLGGVHRWATAAILEGAPSELDESGPQDERLVAGWFADGAGALAWTLRSTYPGRPCWTFGPPPRTAAFWQRRMPHETMLHAWDAHAALGQDLPLDPEFALDGIDEVVTMFVPRQVRLGRLTLPSQSVELHAAEAPSGAGRWRLAAAGDSDGEAPDVIVTAPAAALLLLLWRRIPVDGDGIRVEGDAEAARQVLAAPLTP